MIDANLKDIVAPITGLLGNIVWPVVFVWFIHRFGTQIEQLLGRLNKAKVAGNEFDFQSMAVDGAPPAQTMVEVSQIDERGFISARGIRDAVTNSGLLAAGETVGEPMILFQTGQQQTWVVPSTTQLSLVLDDAATRASARLVQRVMDKKKILPLRFGKDGDSGTVGFSQYPGSWYYTLGIYPTTEHLQRAISRLLQIGDSVV